MWCKRAGRMGEYSSHRTLFVWNTFIMITGSWNQPEHKGKSKMFGILTDFYVYVRLPVAKYTFSRCIPNRFFCKMFTIVSKKLFADYRLLSF